MDTQTETGAGKEAEGKSELGEERERERAREEERNEVNLAAEWIASIFFFQFLLRGKQRLSVPVYLILSALRRSSAHPEAPTDAQLNPITGAAASARHGLRQFCNG